MMKKNLFHILAAASILISAAVSCKSGRADEEDIRVRIDIGRTLDCTGRGNSGETLLDISVRPESGCRLDAMTFRLNSGAPAISGLKLSSGGKVLCSVPVTAGTDSVKMRIRKHIPGTTGFALSADIRPDAHEGELVSVDVTSIDVAGKTVRPQAPLPGGREVLLCRKKLYGPGDYGSVGWRIPAIRQLSDGTLLAVNDRRNDSEEDLPGCIDVVFSYSTDGGRTWSEPGYIARDNGYMHGFGDPGLGELPDGTVVCGFVSGEDLFHSCTESPQRSFVSFSHDHGRSWTEPQEITKTIWGPDAVNPVCKDCHSSFFSSGNYLVLKRGEHKGRLLIANVCHYPGDSWLSNHAVYTDDGGKTWQVSEPAVKGIGDEAKMVELPDGSILMSIRTTGDRIWAKSFDGGQTWPENGKWSDMHVTACNGDLISYNDSILLHSIPMSMQREDVGVMLSFDGGRTWPESKVISPGPGQYSSLTILPDGTIGAYIGKNVTGCEMWYENFSLEWLRRHSAPEKQDMKGVRLWKGGPFWAECNIGAGSPGDPGSFFAWGETRSRLKFGWDRYSGSSYDTAEAILGEGWRVPSEEDFIKLRENCTWTWSERDGYPGYEVKGECGSIFLPAGGYISGHRQRHNGSIGQLWTSTVREPSTASEFYFNSVQTGRFLNRGRDNGLPVRGIKDPASDE